MKKYLIILFLFMNLAYAGYAQHVSAEHAAVEKSKELKAKLNLNNRQYDKVLVIYQETAKKFEKIRSEEHGDNSRMTVKLAPVRRETIREIKAVLTPGQIVKFDKMISQSSSSGEGWSGGWAVM